MKLFYVCPHLSTGGQPQYTLKMIETFKKQFDITVLEVNNYSNDYVVQRNKIEKISRLFQLQGNQNLLLNTIKGYDVSDVIHFQELPESFLSVDILKQLYDAKRKYNIVVTTHSSLTRGRDFKYLPDRIVAVNNWQKELFKRELPNTEIDMWEYPIENKSHERLDYSCHDCESGMSKSRKILGFKEFDYREKNCGLHILNVGLWTPGKNQGDLIEIARKNPQNLYHFVGNQASNFEHYWKPLMKDIPENCVVWGERDDVDLFYQACDEMYFCSKFELNPLVVKEALSYGLPVKMHKLETYGNFYDKNPLITYI